MKTTSFCAPCKAERFYEVTCLSTRDERLRKECMVAVLANIRKAIKRGDCPSFAGTVQSELIMDITGNRDPYRKKKRDVIRAAKRIFPSFREWVSDGKTPYERFKRAVKLAVAGNTLELSAPNHKAHVERMEDEMKQLVKKALTADDIKEIFKNVKNSKEVLYLCDNCGEAVFDIPLISEINKHSSVTAVVSSVPMDEDVSLEEIELVGLGDIPVVGKGRSYGVWKKRAPEGFWRRFETADFIIAKGMANYETLDEYRDVVGGRAACLLRVKCPTVGASLGFGMDSMIAVMIHCQGFVRGQMILKHELH
ncbi:MAG: ARMT1-like domain-containing protein [Candidatus Micrarchaeota archaeon]